VSGPTIPEQIENLQRSVDELTYALCLFRNETIERLKPLRRPWWRFWRRS
jgi:hypothetical protein